MNAGATSKRATIALSSCSLKDGIRSPLNASVANYFVAPASAADSQQGIYQEGPEFATDCKADLLQDSGLSPRISSFTVPESSNADCAQQPECLNAKRGGVDLHAVHPNTGGESLQRDRDRVVQEMAWRYDGRTVR